MRIFVTANEPVYSEGGALIGFSGRYSRDVADAMHSLGHDVVLIAPADSYEMVRSSPYPVRPMVISDDNVSYTDVSYANLDYNFPVYAAHPMSTQVFLRELGLSSDRYLMSQAWSMSTSELLFGRPDVVINTGTSTWNFISSAYPTLVLTHGNDMLDAFAGSPLEGIARAGFSRSSAIIASDGVASKRYDRFASKTDYPRRAGMIPPLLHTEDLRIKRRGLRGELMERYHEELAGIYQSDFWVVHSVELAGVQGVASLLRAAQQYEASNGMRTATIIIGLDSDTQKRLKRMASEMEIFGVRFIEKLQRKEDLALFVSEAHVLTFPSGRYGVGMLYADGVSSDKLSLDGRVAAMNDPIGRVDRVDQNSIATLRLAKSLAERNTDLPVHLRVELISLLNHELRISQNLGALINEVNFSGKVLELAASYKHFAAQEIASDTLLDGVVRGINHFPQAARPNNDRALKLAEKEFGLTSFAQKIERALLKLQAGENDSSRFSGNITQLDRKVRINAIKPDTRVMREFDKLRDAIGTDQFFKAVRRFDRTVMTYLGMRATYSHPLSMAAVADPHVELNGIFTEIARAAGVELAVFNEVLSEIAMVPYSGVMGREYEVPKRRKGQLIKFNSEMKK